MDAVISRRKPTSSKPKSSSSSTSSSVMNIDPPGAATSSTKEEDDEEEDKGKNMVTEDEATATATGGGGTQHYGEQNQNGNVPDVTATLPIISASISTLTEADIEHLPIIVNLRVSIAAAQAACSSGLVESLANSIVECTENWSISQLMALMTST